MIGNRPTVLIMDGLGRTRAHPVRASPHRLRHRSVLATRNPLLLLRFPVSFLLRLAERMFLGLLFQEPPRNTREQRPARLPMAAGPKDRTCRFGRSRGVAATYEHAPHGQSMSPRGGAPPQCPPCPPATDPPIPASGYESGARCPRANGVGRRRSNTNPRKVAGSTVGTTTVLIGWSKKPPTNQKRLNAVSPVFKDRRIVRRTARNHPRSADRALVRPRL